MSDKPQLGPGAWVGYSAEREGYRVTVYDPAGDVVEDYTAGNSPLDSQVYIPLDRKEPRVPLQTLRKWAKQTAGEFAAEYGIAADMIAEEE